MWAKNFAVPDSASLVYCVRPVRFVGTALAKDNDEAGDEREEGGSEKLAARWVVGSRQLALGRLTSGNSNVNS